MEKRIIFRLSTEMYEQVNKAIERGKAKSVSGLIRAALKEFLNPNNAKEDVENAAE